MPQVVVVYVFPLNGADGHLDWGRQFVDSYKRTPAGYEHDLIVISNGARPNADTKALFSELGKVRAYFLHDDSGFDIGAYQHAAQDIHADMMVFFGGRTYVRVPNWLKRMVEVWEQGKGSLFGSMSVLGDPGRGIWPHVRTTGFWMDPALLAKYPIRVKEPAQRYPFEHGPESLTMWCANNKESGVAVATADGLYDMDHWRDIPEGYHQGQQKALLVGDRLTRPPYYPFA